jgi:hypothetical protein
MGAARYFPVEKGDRNKTLTIHCRLVLVFSNGAENVFLPLFTFPFLSFLAIRLNGNMLRYKDMFTLFILWLFNNAYETSGWLWMICKCLRKEFLLLLPSFLLPPFLPSTGFMLKNLSLLTAGEFSWICAPKFNILYLKKRIDSTYRHWIFAFHNGIKL